MSNAIGLAFIVLGYMLRAWGSHHLKLAGTVILAGTKPPHYYTTDGPYKYLVHPLYWGSMMICGGAGIVALGWGGVVLVVPAIPYFVERAILETEMRTVRNGLHKETTGL